MKNEIITAHKLDFEVAPYPNFFEGENWDRYRVGTVEGLWSCDDENYLILSFINSEPNNGHLTDVLQWFEHSAKRDRKNLKILCINNRRFYRHLYSKRGFTRIKGNNSDLIKFIEKK